eukprot:TRINITY_DN3225_c0_g1_i2.p1 TRINITY_DN3225_c0_g1~~TRINITY_DN3225_c0_g1_i2.p1  ORF type:complete len:292 (+),score=27.05 TRINITY_DN3225_c0_g1_i2:3-878(+)
MGNYKQTFISQMKLNLLAIFLLIFLYSVEAFNNPKCRGKRYMCAPAESPNAPNVCVNVTDFREKLHYITPCDENDSNGNTYCPWDQASFNKSANCTKAPSKDLIYPGEKCSQNSDCFSKRCENGVCVGTQAGENCTMHRDCDVNLYCTDKLICEKQKEYNEPCKSDYDCVNNCACNLGRCAYYYQFEDDIPADNPKTCASGYVKDKKCKKGRISQYKGRPCDNDQDCALVDGDGNTIDYSECSCGYNGGGFTYCQLAEGDDEFQEAVNKFQFILFRSYGCHTLLRLSLIHI